MRASASTIDFDVARSATGAWDFMIGSQSLAQRLGKHERLEVEGPQGLVSALGTVPGTKSRLLLESEPDLTAGATALLVCAVCGGYDGGPIGARVERHGDIVVWRDLGYYPDVGDDGPALFDRVTSFAFEWEQYRGVLATVSVS
ncbi:MAG: hypothetical protein AAFZ58_03205 [Pseudomonadota bacterium]